MSSRPVRLRFDRVERKLEGGKEWFEVTLSFYDRPVTGRSQALDTSESRRGIRRTAAATLNAIEACIGDRLTCELQEVDIVRALGKERVVMLVAATFEGRRIQLFGTCVTGDDFLIATAKAALDAANRYIDIVLSNQEQ